MRHLLLACIFTLPALLSLPLHAQQDAFADQEAFALALAKARARTYLHSVGTPPSHVSAQGESYLALRATGKVSFEEDWVDATHWRDTLHFADFTRSSVRNDNGPYWTTKSESFIPIRAAEAYTFLHFEVPSTSQASSYLVKQSSETSAEGLAVTCFAGSLPTLSDRYPRNYKWCFDTANGLLRSADIPLNIHIVFSNYLPFNGRQEYTHVSATAGALRIFDADLTYRSIPADTLAQLIPTPGMKRRDPPRDPTEQATMRYQPMLQAARAALPANTAAHDAHDAVTLRFLIGADGAPVDAGAEQAPDEAMAQAALNVAHDFRFQPPTSDMQVPTRILHQVEFGASADPSIALAPRMRLDQVREIFNTLQLQEATERMAKKVTLLQKQKMPPWWPASLFAQMEEAAAQVDPAPIDLPFYQQCYSEQDGRLLVDIFNTPEGRAWGRYAIGFSLDEQEQGVAAPNAVSDAARNKPVFTGELLKQLNEQDREYAREAFNPQRVAATRACMAGVSEKAIAAVQAVQLDAMSKVIAAHQQEIEAAQAEYQAQQNGHRSQP